MTKHDINLTDHDDRFVEELITSGRYKNASEVMRAGLRLLEQQSWEDERKLATLRGLAAEAFAAPGRIEGTMLEEDQQLAEFIGGIGRRPSGTSKRSWPEPQPSPSRRVPGLIPGRNNRYTNK